MPSNRLLAQGSMTALGFFASLPGICRVNPYLYLICPVQYAGYYDLLEDKIRYGTILLLCHGAEHSCLLRSVFFGTAEAEILPAGNEAQTGDRRITQTYGIHAGMCPVHINACHILELEKIALLRRNMVVEVREVIPQIVEGRNSQIRGKQ